MIDTHCHLTFDELYSDLSGVLQRAADEGVDRMVTVSTTPSDAERCAELAGRFANIFATVGVHPHYADRWDNKSEVQEAMRRLITQPGVVAFGEMGLDRHYPDPPMDDQRRAFAWQLEVAAGLDGVPIVIHNREATDETLAILRDSGIAPSRFQFHCFTGSREELDAILEFGAMVSYTGIVTFRSAAALAEGAASVPLDRLMIETDSPYLTPEPHRKVRPNQPCYVADVARFLAAGRDMSLDAFVASVDANAERFFSLSDASQ